MTALADSNFLELLKTIAELTWPNVKHFPPVVLMSSRQFWGYKFRSFPVRNVHEFASFIAGGEFSLRMPGENEEVFGLWSGNNLSNADVLKYLSRDGRPHTFFFDSMIVYYLTYKGKLKVNRFSRNVTDVQARMRTNLRIKERE